MAVATKRALSPDPIDGIPKLVGRARVAAGAVGAHVDDDSAALGEDHAVVFALDAAGRVSAAPVELRDRGVPVL